MNTTKSLTMNNSQSADVSELLELALSNLAYPHERRVHYVLLVEEALLKWRNELPADTELVYERKDTPTDVKITLTVAGKKSDPFSVTPDEAKGMTPEHMIDRLLSGVGSELKYRYKHGINRVEICLPKSDIEATVFRRNLYIVMIPIALQTLLENVASNIDALMLGFLSAADMSAVSLAAKFVSVFLFAITAIATTLSMLASQFWGVRDRKSISQMASVSMKSSLIISILFFIVTALFPEKVMSLYTDNAQFIAAGVKYLRILSPYFIIVPLFRIPYSVMRSTGRVKASVIYAVTGCAVNIVLNGILIFGLFGLPAMGINGAAFSTVLSGLLQTVFVAADSIFSKGFRANYFKGLLISNPQTGPFLSAAFPTIVQHLSWILAINVITATIGHMSTDIVAANSALLIVGDMVASVRNGAGGAAGMLMANTLGKGKLDEARRKSRLLMQIGLRFGFICSAVLVIIAYCLRFLPMDLSAGAIKCMNVLIIAYAVNTLFAMLNAMINHGMSFPGGDSKGVLLMDAIALWGILIPLALIGPRLSFMPSLLLISILKVDELISFPFKYSRSKKEIWLKSLVKK